MKKLILFVFATLLFTSCIVDSFQCPSYGETNRMTRKGNKSQAHYTKHNKLRW
jgi:hypothetical protein